MSMNVAAIMGRIVAQPELRTTTSGTSVTSFTVAVDRNYVKPGQERETDFIAVVAWRQTAEFVCKHFGKGDLIAVKGSIQTRNYEDKQGNKRTAVEILAETVSFCGGKKQEKPAEAPPAPEPPAQEPQRVDDDFSLLDTDDDLPF